MFEKASRLKLRFNYKGVCTVEDLWDLKVEELDSLFKTLNAKAKVENEESLLTTKTTATTELDLQIEIIKHIVSEKLAEEEARKNAREKREKKKKIMELIATKQDSALAEKSVGDLKKMLDDLD